MRLAENWPFVQLSRNGSQHRVLGNLKGPFPSGGIKYPPEKGELTLTMLQLVLWALLALRGVGGAPPEGAQTAKAPQSFRQEKATTQNPHGPTLTIPCENCHRVTAWRPIKANPEFDHNNTRYPLRGMHEKAECTRCHVKPVFTDVGKNCQDCHTDVHQ